MAERKRRSRAAAPLVIDSPAPERLAPPQLPSSPADLRWPTELERLREGSNGVRSEIVEENDARWSKIYMYLDGRDQGWVNYSREKLGNVIIMLMRDYEALGRLN